MIIDPPFKRLYHDNASLVKFPLALGYLSGGGLEVDGLGGPSLQR